jgi:hypothetical protein
VVQLAQALVDAPAQAADGDDVQGGAVFVVMVRADVGDGLAEVGGFLVRVEDDVCFVVGFVVLLAWAPLGGRAGGVVGLCLGGEAVEVAYYDGEVVLRGGSVNVVFVIQLEESRGGLQKTCRRVVRLRRTDSLLRHRRRCGHMLSLNLWSASACSMFISFRWIVLLL